MGQKFEFSFFCTITLQLCIYCVNSYGIHKEGFPKRQPIAVLFGRK